jgi:hypothetical protein
MSLLHRIVIHSTYSSRSRLRLGRDVVETCDWVFVELGSSSSRGWEMRSLQSGIGHVM